MPHVLTFDLGTTYFKAVIFDDAGRCVALERAPTPIDAPQPEWVQIDPVRFRETIAQVCASLQRTAPEAYRDVRAVSFASQTNSFVLLDEHDEPTTPIIVWTDRRAADRTDWLERINTLPHRYEHTGIPRVAPQFAASKLQWLMDEQPRAWSAAKRFCLISDYFTYWLTGAHVTEAGASGLTSLLDIHTCQWWAPALETARVDVAMLPTVVRAGTDVGPLRKEVASDLRLSSDCRFVVGSLDQYAGAIGAANVAPGTVSETTGTVLAVVECSDTFDPTLVERGVIQGPTFTEGLYYRMIARGLSANILEAYQRDHAPEHSFAQLGDMAEHALADETHCALDVEASEANNAPVFKQSPKSHGDAVLAIMQAVSERLDEQLRAVCDTARPARVVCLGGAARSDIWRRLKARATGCEMAATDCEEPTSFGAWLLATSGLRRQPVQALAQSRVKVRSESETTGVDGPTAP